MRSRPVIPVERRDLWSAQDLAAVMGCGRTFILQADKAGLIPAPVRVGGLVRWRAAEIRDWLAAGAPPRDGVGRRWEWRPTLPAKLERYIKLLEQEAAELDATLAEARARRDAGDYYVAVRQ